MMTINDRFPSAAIIRCLFLLVIFVATASVPASSQSPVTFSLRTTDGGEISSEMLRGDVVVLAFGASWLPLSAQGVQELADEYQDRNVRVYWVSTEPVATKAKDAVTDTQLRAFAKKHRLKIAVLRDPDGALLKQLGADQLPSIVILDREGRVSGAPIGGLNPTGKLIDQLSPRLGILLRGTN